MSKLEETKEFLMPLPRSTPQAEGVDPAAIERLLDSLATKDLRVHSLMVLRHGSVIAEGWWRPYAAETPHIMFSVSKSFTSTAIGIAQDEGLLSVDEPILNFFPSYATETAKANTADLRLRHVLSMATGHPVDTMELMRALPNHDWVEIFLESPIVYPPGEHFLYNSGASFMLSAAITARTGLTVREFLATRLFAPMGLATPPWETNPRGISLGASGLRLRTEELAAFGQLYLQRGEWNGSRIFSERWVDEATVSHVATGRDDPDWNQGYGFQFWRSRHGFRADGAHGQFCLVLPEQDAVIAITAGTGRAPEVLDALWDELLPGFSAGELPEDPVAVDRLRSRLTGLTLQVESFATNAASTRFSGGAPVNLPANLLGVARLRLEPGATVDRLVLTGLDGHEESHPIGRGDWLPGETTFWPHEEMDRVAVATRGGWIEGGRYRIVQQCVETPFARTWTISDDQDGAGVLVEVGLDHGFWRQETESLLGAIV
jgi:CubicO group peptidase (beta-lactamase class C family)